MVGQVAHVPGTRLREHHGEGQCVKGLDGTSSIAGDPTTTTDADGGVVLSPSPFEDEVVFVVGHV